MGEAMSGPSGRAGVNGWRPVVDGWRGRSGWVAGPHGQLGLHGPVNNGNGRSNERRSGEYAALYE